MTDKILTAAAKVMKDPRASKHDKVTAATALTQRMSVMDSALDQLTACRKRIADLEADRDRLHRVMYDMAHKAATLGSGTDGYLRGQFMSISNALNAAIGRTQSSHGQQYDADGSVNERR